VVVTKIEVGVGGRWVTFTHNMVYNRRIKVFKNTKQKIANTTSSTIQHLLK